MFSFRSRRELCATASSKNARRAGKMMQVVVFLLVLFSPCFAVIQHHLSGIAWTYAANQVWIVSNKGLGKDEFANCSGITPSLLLNHPCLQTPC